MGKSLKEIAQQLESANKKVQLIYAFNGTGKTRLSREFETGESTLPILVSYDATPYVVTEDGVFYISEELYNTLKIGDMFLPNENTPQERPRRIGK